MCTEPSTTGAYFTGGRPIDHYMYLGIIAVVLALTQFLGPNIRVLLRHHTPQASSFGGGVAIAYIFLVLFPELDIAHEWLGEHIHLVALTSFLSFYIIELVLAANITWTRLGVHLPHRDSTPATRAFWFHLGILWLFSFMIVFTMPESRADSVVFAVFGTLTIALRLIYKDYVLRMHQDQRYQDSGRYLLTIAPITGVFAHWLFEPTEVVLDVFVAILAGAILQSVFRQELPTIDGVKLPWLLAGVTTFTVLVNVT
jgi:drug/metabolite transporter superfamily protein YnfA